MQPAKMPSEHSANPALDAQYVRELLTIEEAAQRLKVAPKTVRKLCQSRSLTAIRVQRRWRIPAIAIDDFLRERLILRV
jgi:excisionase family DNA binding protein